MWQASMLPRQHNWIMMVVKIDMAAISRYIVSNVVCESDQIRLDQTIDNYWQ